VQASGVDDSEELGTLGAVARQPGVLVLPLGLALWLAGFEGSDRAVAGVLVPAVGAQVEELLQHRGHRVLCTFEVARTCLQASARSAGIGFSLR
jgi:hypothetical protein